MVLRGSIYPRIAVVYPNPLQFQVAGDIFYHKEFRKIACVASRSPDRINSVSDKNMVKKVVESAKVISGKPHEKEDGVPGVYIVGKGGGYGML